MRSNTPTPLQQAKQIERNQKQRFDLKKWKDIYQLIGYKRITNDKHHFIVLKKDFGYAEICRIPGAPLSSLPDTMVNKPTSSLTRLLQRFDPDWSFVATQFPATTDKQQLSFGQDYIKVQEQLVKAKEQHEIKALKTRLSYIEEELNVAKNVEKVLKNQEYFAIVFGKNIKELNERLSTLDRYSDQYIHFEPLSLERKEMFLYSLNNMADKKI